MLRRSLLPATLALLLGVAEAQLPAAAEADPAALITDLGNRALAVLGKDVSPRQREARFRQLFDQDFDVPTIAHFVLGRYWRTATKAEQQEFVRLFAAYIALAYSNRLAQYSGETLRVLGSRPELDGSIVSSEIVRTGGAQPAKVDWRLRSNGGTYKITDVIVDGISMAVTQRSEFASVIQRHGGEVGGLLSLLRERTAGAEVRP
jgi:phospholipid transport system substrate-binding protein